MFRAIHALVLVAGLVGVVGQGLAQDPVTERPGKSQPMSSPAGQKQAPAVASKLIMIFEGREELGNQGNLAFHVYQDGKSVMIDATKQPVVGTVKVEDNRIQFVFGNCIYDGTESKGGIVSGKARFTSGTNAGKSWNFNLSIRNSVINRSFAGRETLPGYGNINFRFVDETTVEMTDQDGVTRGMYAQNGTQITMTFGTAVYNGEVRVDTIVGSARNHDTNWTFEVNASK